MNNDAAIATAAPEQTLSARTQLSDTTRYHHLDAVRAFALLLGVFFHAAESFGPDNHYWAIVDSSPSQLLDDIRFACHAFRLELFFLIAGFFARLLLLRRGVGGFTRNRALRILVPFVVGWLIIYPLLVYIWLWGRSISGNFADLGIPPEARNYAPWQLWLGFFYTLGFLKKFDLTHLWFLHQLMVLYLIFISARAVFQKTGAKLNTRLRELADRAFARLVASPFALIAFAVVAFPVLLTMRGWDVDTPKESLIPHLPTTLLFGYCFLVGWFFHRQPALLDHMARRWAAHLGIGLVLWFAFGLFSEDAIRRMSPDDQWRVRLTFTFMYAHLMWAFVLGFLGLFTRFCSRPSAWSRYLADSSYWIYLAHLPLIVALQVQFGRVPLPWTLKYPLIVLIATVLLYLSYHYLVRATFIGATLNGHKYPRIWPWNQRTARE